MKLSMNAFIKHSKFVTVSKMFQKYESFCKRQAVKFIPTFLKHKIWRPGDNAKEKKPYIFIFKLKASKKKKKWKKNTKMIRNLKIIENFYLEIMINN